jgi:hypothetical protein
MLSLLSVAVNCAIIFFTSNALSYIVDTTYTDLSKFMVIVMIEHIIIGFKLFISIVIKDKPQWVTQSEQELIEYEEQVRDQIEAKKDEYLAGGGVLLEEQMAEAKRRLQQQMGAALEKAHKESKAEEDKEQQDKGSGNTSAIIRMM